MPEKARASIPRKTKKKTSQIRTNHLLVIGIDEYSNQVPTLNNAVRDAESFKDMLLETYQFEEKNCTCLFNEEATRANIIHAFATLLEKLTDNDNLVFYYSGHGEQITKGKGDRGYWIPCDASLHQDWTYLPNEEITLLFKNSFAHHIFGVVDSCFSGSLFRTRKLSDVEERLESAPSRWLLTAGRIEPVSDGSLGQNSPFATSLLTHLRTNQDNTIWTSELCNRVLKGVSFNTDKQTPRGEPLQNVGHEGGQFVFYKKDFKPQQQEEKESAENANKTNLGASRESERSTKSEVVVDSLIQLKQHLKLLIAKDIEKAIETFNQYLDPASSLVNDLILQSAGYNSTKTSHNRDIITFDQANRTFNHIRFALLGYIDSLELEDVIFKTTSSEKIEYNNTKGKRILLNLSQLEQSGLKKRAELIIKKLEKLNTALVIEVDAARQFQYETQIEDLENQLTEIKKKIE